MAGLASATAPAVRSGWINDDGVDDPSLQALTVYRLSVDDDDPYVAGSNPH